MVYRGSRYVALIAYTSTKGCPLDCVYIRGTSSLTTLAEGVKDGAKGVVYLDGQPGIPDEG
jgi:hypothetical protein